jgi:hypothetical protein
MKNKRNAENLNHDMVWSYWAWSITRFLPSLQFMFIFGLLLSAEALSASQTRQGGRPTQQLTPYKKLLALCENYSPSSFSEVHNLLMTAGTQENLIRYSDIQKNPLTIAQQTENVDLAKLVLDTTGTLFCSQKQQAYIEHDDAGESKGYIPTAIVSENKLRITLLMLQAGCKPQSFAAGDYRKYINGLSLVTIMPSLGNNIPVGFNRQLSEMVFITFLEQINERDNFGLTDEATQRLIDTSTQIAMYLYSNKNNESPLELLIAHHLKYHGAFRPKNPLMDRLYTAMSIAVEKYPSKTVNFFLQFIGDKEELDAYIKQASNDNDKKLQDLLQRTKVTADLNYGKKIPDDVISSETQTILYRRARIEYWIIHADIHQLTKELSIFDKLFGKYPSTQRYVVAAKVIAGQLKEAKAVLLNEKQPQEYHQTFLDFVELISKPHPIRIERFQPPSLAVIQLNKIDIANSMIMSKVHATVPKNLRIFSEKKLNPLTEMLNAVDKEKNKSQKKILHTALIEEIKKIDNHSLYFLEPALVDALLQSMFLANNIEECFRYFKMAILLDPTVTERIFTNSKDNFLLFTAYSFIKIFSQRYPDEMYSYIKRKLLDYARLGYTTRQLDGFLDIAKAVINDFYGQTMPAAIFPENPNLDHLTALHTMSIASGNYSIVSEEVILSEINALQQRKLLGEEFKLGERTYTLETLQFEFIKLRLQAWKLPAILISIAIGILTFFTYRYVNTVKAQRRNAKATPPKPKADPAIIADNILRIAEELPKHEYIGTLEMLQFHKDGPGKHILRVILPATLSKDLFSSYSIEGFTPIDETLTKEQVESAILYASQNKNHTVIATLETQEAGLVLRLEIDNNAVVFEHHYRLFMDSFQKHLIDNSKQVTKIKLISEKADCIKELTESHQKSASHEQNINTIEEYEKLKKKVDEELAVPGLARSQRRTALRTVQQLTDDILVLSKQTKPPHCLLLPDFSKLTLTDCKELLKGWKATEQALSDLSKKMKDKNEKLTPEVVELKRLFKNDGKKFDFEWGTGSYSNVTASLAIASTATQPKRPAPPLVNHDDDGDREITETISDDPPAQVTNDDDDNDKELPATPTENPKTQSASENDNIEQDLLAAGVSLDEIKSQLTLIPIGWFQQVHASKLKSQSTSSSSSSSSSNDLNRARLTEDEEKLIANAEQLCAEIVTTVQPLEHDSIDDATRRKCIYQLIDLYARFNIALNNIPARLIQRTGLLEDVDSIRNALRHNATYFIHSERNPVLNREIYTFCRDLSQSFQNARGQKSSRPKNDILAIRAHSETESALSAEQLGIALQAEFQFLHRQLSKPDATLRFLVSEGQSYFYAGFLTQIGNLMHEFHHRFPNHSVTLMPNTNAFSKLEDCTMKKLSLDKLTTSNLLYLCWELRNNRGHDSIIEPPNQVFIYDLMRAVVIKLDEFNTQLAQFIPTLAVAAASTMAH